MDIYARQKDTFFLSQIEVIVSWCVALRLSVWKLFICDHHIVNGNECQKLPKSYFSMNLLFVWLKTDF